MSVVENAGEGAESTEPLCDVGGNEISTATLEIKAAVFKKLGVKLPGDLAIPVLSRQGAKGNEIAIVTILPCL